MKLRILYLEDSPNDAALVADIIHEEWPEAEIVCTRARADFLANLESSRFDLILSDYSLPGFSGTEALELASRLQPEIPFIFVSGTIGEEVAIEALQKGAADYVIKDRPARLVPAIQQALARAESAARALRAERALLESQQRFHQMAEQSSDVFWFCSLDPDRLLYVSPAVERLWGRPAAEFYAEPRLWLAAIHEEDRPRVAAAHAAWVQGSAPAFEEEYRVVRPDGSICWVLDSGTLIRDNDGKVCRLSGIAKDITARRAAEEQLRGQAALLDKARDAIVALDLTLRVFYWNSSATRIFNWATGETFSRNLSELGFDRELSNLENVRNHVLATGEWSGELHYRNPSGEVRLLETSWSLVHNAAGQPFSILFIGSDVTEKKLVEKQLLQAERMDSLGMLASGVAHDLNNVLAPILMGADLLLKTPLDPKFVRLVENMDRSAQHGAALVRQLLTYAKGGEVQRAEVSVPKLLEDVRKLLVQNIPENVVVTVDAATVTQPLHADVTQLKQVLLNLGLNARDAMPGGGRLDLSATVEPVSAAQARLFPGSSTGPHVRISVADTGTGIPPAILAKIFDPFFTTKGVGKGTGLGLSTAAGIVKNHGGFIDVKSDLGRGTQFHVYLPLPAAPLPASSRSKDPFGTIARGERVLVIDDEPAIRETMRLLLGDCGFRVVTAPDGDVALREIAQSAGEISAVITDICLPGMSGVELIAAIRSRSPALPVLAMSGQIDASQRTQLSAMTPRVPLMQKPISGDSLVENLHQILGLPSPTPPAPPGSPPSP